MFFFPDRRYIKWLSVVTIAFNYNVWLATARLCFPYHTPVTIPYWIFFDILADLVNIIDITMFQPRLQFVKAGDIIVSESWYGHLHFWNCDSRTSTQKPTNLFPQKDRIMAKQKYRESARFQVCTIYIYSCAHKFTYPLQNVQNVNNWNKIRGIMNIACYFLFSTVLNKLFHITDVYIYSTRQNNNWIYKNDPVQKFTYPWILILCVISWMIHNCFYILW